MHSSDSLRVRGYEFPSNSYNVDQHFQVQISPMRLPSKSEGHRCLKYQNVPYIRNFWHIGKPWERFQHWVRLIYFLTVPDDHTVVSSKDSEMDCRMSRGDLRRVLRKTHRSHHLHWSAEGNFNDAVDFSEVRLVVAFKIDATGFDRILSWDSKRLKRTGQRHIGKVYGGFLAFSTTVV